MNKEEAEDLIEHIKLIDTVWIQEEKRREQMYKEAIRTYDCKSLVQIIKTLYLRKAEELLYSEMSLALSIPKEQVEEYITQAVDKQ